MPCLVAAIAFFFPRLAIVLMVIFGDYIGTAYHTVFWPLLGFVFAPYTTLAYAFSINSHGSIDGMYIVLMVVAVLFDLGVLGGGSSSARSKRVRTD